MKEITLTKGRVTIVDDSDYEALSAYNWQFDVRGYAARTSGSGYPKRRHYRLHREVLGITDPNIHVDHINGDRLDNRRSNLRLCTNGENLRNRGAQKNNTSGFKGVCWNKDRNGWMAQISFQNKKHFLGVFETPEEAHEAYKAAAASFHGVFANPGKSGEAIGWKLAMRVLQSDLYTTLDDAERAECDALIRTNPYSAAIAPRGKA